LLLVVVLVELGWVEEEVLVDCFPARSRLLKTLFIP
jgi:hypothetical protein